MNGHRQKLKFALAINDSGIWSDQFDDNGVIVLRSTEQTVEGGWRIVDPARLAFSRSLPERSFLKAGDIVITKSSGSSLHIGKASLVDDSIEALRCTFSNFMQRLRCKTGYSPKYLWYYLNSSHGRAQFDRNSSTTTGLANLNGTLIGNFELCFPTYDRQHRIAVYLDEQTAKIDHLIKLRQRQIELLREQRAALIQQAATRGLNPDVPMRYSGIPWLGEIPAHWSIVPLGRLSTLLQTGPFGSQLHADEYIEEGIPIINPSHLENGRIIHDSKCSVDAATANRLARHALVEGDIVFARRGELGRCGLVTVEKIGWLCGTGSLLMRPDKYALEPAYLVSLFQLKRLKEAVSLHSVGATMENLNTGILARIRLPLPPLYEQIEILNHIGSENRRIMALTAAYERQIALLQEYRASLIHECVTGQHTIPVSCAP